MEDFGKKMQNENGSVLGSLLDDILVCILSLLPTNMAVRTSVLSRCWKNLWTAVTSIEFEGPYSNRSPSIYSILCCLTSPILRRLVVVANHLDDVFSDVQCFPLVCDRKVKEIKVTSSSFWLPACIFQCQTLVVLDLNITKTCNFRKTTTFNLPRLKKLRFSYGMKSFHVIENLLNSCPMLEDLEVQLEQIVHSPYINIRGPHLKSLRFEMLGPLEQHQIIIDAPKLTFLRVQNSGSLLKLVTDVIELDTADLDVSYVPQLRVKKGMDENDYIQEISKFVVRLSDVRNFWVTSNIRLFGYLPTSIQFANLSYVNTTLNGKYDDSDLVVFLQMAPNLKEIVVSLDYWSGNPVSGLTSLHYPEPLFSNLKKVCLVGLQGNNDEVNLVGYFVRNGIKLNTLWMFCYVNLDVTDDNARIGMELKFFKACFNLPRNSPSTKISLSGQYVQATSENAPRREEFIVGG